MRDKILETIGQEGDEKVILILRRHKIVFLLPTLGFVFLFILGIISLVFLINSVPVSTKSPFLNFMVIIGSSYFLSLILVFFIYWLDFYFDVSVITNTRIIDIDQHGLFYRDIAKLNLKQIQDVNVVMKGIFETFFNFGDVHVQTAGTQRNFDLNKVPNPQEVAKKILDLHEELIHQP